MLSLYDARCAHCNKRINLDNYLKVGEFYFCNNEHFEEYCQEKDLASKGDFFFIKE